MIAKDNVDRIIGFPSPQSITLENNGEVVLFGLMREEALNLQNFFEVGQTVHIQEMSEKPDRQNRKIVRLYSKDGQWNGAKIIRSGFARVYPDLTFKADLRELYQHETMARQSEFGLWKSDQFQIEDGLNENMKRNQYGIVEGLVVDVATFKDRIYLNFGANWRTDFSAVIEKKNFRFFREFGWEVSILEGKRIQLRGWIFEQNGPMINLGHPFQLQLMNR